MILVELFPILSAVGLAFSVLTFFRVRVHGYLLVPTFLVGWLRGELALQAIVLEAVAVALVVRAGALETTAGVFGLACCVVSWGLLIAAHRRGLGAGREFAEALAPAGIETDQTVSALHGFPNPFRYGHPDVKRIQDRVYGPSLPGDKGGRNLMDLVLPKAARAGDKRPVLLQVHGGGWIIGDKREQGRPLMTKLASRGWVCVAINYRLSPKATMPDHLVDVKRSIAWIRAHIAEYGGDPDFLCITGGSAGGHLSSLAALTADDPIFQPGFEEVDTRVDACVPFYGVFDFLDRADDRALGKMADLIGPLVFKCTPEENPGLWESVCSLARVHAEAPPFLVIQGTHDSLVMAEEAVTFVSALRAVSTRPVLYAELKGAQHAFEIFHSPRTEHAIRAVAAFLEGVHSDYAKGEARLA
ncbi:MAG: alpha/beta hydrolase [bacterium]|nr:alpha/beta hydrolase [bacterium]